METLTLTPFGGGGTGGGGTPGGSDTQVQFNDGGAFGGDADLTWNKTTNVLTNRGDINLDDGGSFTTTVQCVTPTQNRTISFPDATGTLALVAGSSGQLLWNNAGANAGASTLTYDGSILTTSGRFINSYNATASAPAKAFTGTWFTGGTSTTTKPQVLIEPTGATSTAWSTSGTGLGVNAASGFAGNLLDLQVNGTSQLRVGPGGAIGGNGDNIRILGASSTANLQLSAPQNNNSAVQFLHSGTASAAGTAVGYVGRISSHFGFFDGGGAVRLAIPSGATDRWAFFGTTSSFPALKQSGATLQARLADDSAYTTIDAQLRAQGTAPANATATGTAGDIRYDADYIYICTATNTWKRAALATW